MPANTAAAVASTGNPAGRERRRRAPLTADQERKLARRMAEGRMAAAELEARRVRGRRKAELQALVRDGADAREELITKNLPLVGTLAMTYRHTGVELPDLIGEGRIGLIKAADTFDGRHGVPFSAWARKPIIQSIERHSMTTASPMRMPVDALYDRRLIEQAREKLRLSSGREASLSELSQETGIGQRRIGEILGAPRTMTPVGPGEDEVLDDPGLAASDGDPEDAGVDADLLARQEEAFSLWTADERRVLLLRVGVTSGDPTSVQQVAEILGMTPRAVHALERSAIAKTAHPRHKLIPPRGE